MTWKTVTLKSVCKKVTDGTHDTPKNIASGYPLIKGKDISNGYIDFKNCGHISDAEHQIIIKRSKPEKGDVLFANIGNSIGDCVYVNTDRPFSIKNIALFKPDQEIVNPRFLYYTVNNKKFIGEILAVKSGAAQPFVSLETLRRHKINFPCLSIQTKIANILSAYDDLIENNLKLIKLLEEMAQITYEEWFVRLRFPSHEQTKIDTETGLPEGWEYLPFEDLIDFKEGPGLRNWQYRDKGIPFLNIRVIKDGDVDVTKVQFLDPNEVDTKYKHFLLIENDHVISSSGTLGRLVTIRNCHLPLCLNTSLIRMRVKNSRYGTWLIKHMLLGTFFQNALTSYANGSAQVNFGPIHLKQIKLIAPPTELAIQYEKVAAPIEESIKILRDQNGRLKEARDILLPRLMTGVIDVSTLMKDAA